MGSARARRLIVRGVVALLVLLASAAGGLYAAAGLAPERLRTTIERTLSQATGAPCTLEQLRVVPGLPLALEGRGLALWRGGLRVEQARARVSLWAALLGEARLSRLELRGASLRVRWDGAPVFPWSRGRAPAEAPPPLEALPPLAVRVLERALDAILAEPIAATRLLVRDSRIVLEGPGAERPARLALEIAEGEIVHSRLLGNAQLVARTRVVEGGVARGALVWQASRERSGLLDLAVEAEALDLGWLGRSLEGPLRLRGSLSGSADYRIPAPGRARADVELALRDVGLVNLASAETLSSATPLTAAFRIALDEELLEISRLRLASEEGFALALDAALSNSPGRGASLGLSAQASEIELGTVRTLAAVLPAPAAEGLRAVTAALAGGRIAALEARGAAPLSDWGDILSGRARVLPQGLVLEARVEELDVLLGRDDRIEAVSASLLWVGDRLELRDAGGWRAGVPLPALDFELDGVSHLVAADLSRRVPPSQAIHLPGLPLLLSLFGDAEEAPARSGAPQLALRVERLEHPALLWPVEGLDLEVRPDGSGLAAEVRSLRWAGVPFRGAVRWRDRPQHLSVRFEAAAQAEPGVAPSGRSVGGGAAREAAERVWAAGFFEIGPIESAVWRHERLSGRFEAVRSELRFAELEAELAPRGQVSGHGALDLGRIEALPYGATFVARDLDAAALLAQAGLGEGVVSGRVDLRGELSSVYEGGGASRFAHLTGRLDVDAYDGAVARKLPAVLALTLASKGLDFTLGRESIRYDHVSVPMTLREGRVASEAFTLEGPDLRAFGSGTLDLARPPHRLEAELAIFLFRPVDRAIRAIPFINTLLLGESENLIAAYFELEGPWNAPSAEPKPLRTLTRGSLEVMKGVPRVMLRGLEMLGVPLGDEPDGEEGR